MLQKRDRQRRDGGHIRRFFSPLKWPKMTEFRNLIEALNAAPAERPFVTAWVNEDEHETLTFGEFRERARIQAGRLRQEGLEWGDRVIIVMPQGIAAMTVFIGAMVLGAAPAFLAYPNDRVEPSKYRSGLSGVTANLRATVVVVDGAFPDELLGHVTVAAGTKVVRAGADAVVHGRLQGPANSEIAHGNMGIAFIQHSAGTTGLQKGVALTHGAVLRQLRHLSQSLHIQPSDRIYSWLPLYHDMGLIACFMLPMVCHIPLVMQSPVDWVMHPETMLQVISEYKCTLAWLPNFAFQFVARRTRPERRAGYDLSSMRTFINCSEPVRASSMEEFEAAFKSIGLKPSALHSSYAMAENVFAVTQSRVPASALDGAAVSEARTASLSGPTRIWADCKQFRGTHRIVSAKQGTPGAVYFVSSGRLLPGNEVRIVSDSGAELTPDSVGEILVKSDSLFDGYYNRPDLTAKAFVDGWYRTGDLGFMLDGELFVVGRKKDLIIVGGENIHPQDIEEIADKHSAIRDGRVVAVGLYNPDLGTEEIVLVAEVEKESHLANAMAIERELRSLVMAGMGVVVSTIFLKPPKWIVKSTAGKPARSGTLEKLLNEHPELRLE
jgi:acyl-CoA synthetase (AMP-forming)/AMP-acid ligase II